MGFFEFLFLVAKQECTHPSVMAIMFVLGMEE